MVPFISPIIDTWIKPKFAKILSKGKTSKDLIDHAFVNKFEEYLERSLQKNSKITILAFGNQPRDIERIYIPLTVHVEETPNLFNTNRLLSQNYRITGFNDNFIPFLGRVVITDNAGMGKSTILKYLFISAIKENKGIPVLIELRKLTACHTILDHIIQELSPIDDEFDKDFILQVIKKGDFIFFFDGLDEVPGKERKAVVSDLQNFISKAGKNQFVLTSRPESALATFSDFAQATIKPLTKDEAFDLLRKYDSGSEIAKGIIKKLKSPKADHFESFLGNPFLVSLLFKSYEYKAIIPIKKHIFYRQVYDALFESHDLSKGDSYVREKHSNLDSDDFHRVLRVLGLITVKEGRIEYSKDDILKKLALAKSFCPGIAFKLTDFLRDLLTTVPLFNSEGNYFRWSHKSFQEYFAAQYICTDAKADQAKMLREMYANDNGIRYLNVLDLCGDIDFKTFRNTVIYDLLVKYFSYYNNSYVQVNLKDIAEKEIGRRKQVCFGNILAVVIEGLGKSGKTTDALARYVDRFSRGKIKKVYFFEKRDAESNDSSTGVARFLIGYDIDGTILNIFETKLNILYKKHKKQHSFDTTDNLPKLFRSNNNYVALEINDDPNAIFNRPKNFAVVTDLFYGLVETVIDTEKAKRLLNQIITDKENEEKSDRLLKDF